MKKYEDILIIRSGGLGDMLFIAPAIHAIRTNFPDAKISTMVPASWVDFLRTNKDIDQVIEDCYQPFDGMGGFAHVIKVYDFDLVINFDPVKIYNYKDWPSGLEVKSIWSLVNHNALLIDFYKYNSPNLVLEICDPKKHNVKNCLSLLKKAGLNINSERLTLDIKREDAEFINNLLFEYNIGKETPLIALHPGTSSSDSPVLQNLLGRVRLLLKKRLPVDRKRWPLKYYADLVNLLHGELGIKVIITGSKYESRLAQQISIYSDLKPVNLCGKTTINQLAALYKTCCLVVCSDTGPLHLAAAVGTPVVGLYGYTEPAHTRPWMEESRFKIVSSNLECSPCKFSKRKKICWRANCIRKIRPREVFEAIKELISNQVKIDE